MSNEIVPQQQSALTTQIMSPDLFGRPRVSKTHIVRVRNQVGEALVSQVKLERAKQTAVTGMLAENQLRNLADALCADNPNARMAADDYIKAYHATAITEVFKAGS